MRRIELNNPDGESPAERPAGIDTPSGRIETGSGSVKTRSGPADIAPGPDAA
ncbi:hypothetical protein [Salinispora oceanensis]|uniref:hypothetical protein n=1 Tax=Salinispora oceanensis TaxID=1050199 RepID=UPI00037DE38B|nr:hypothetical protein [Salinispora oceanensis]